MNNLETLQISSTHPCLVIYLLDQSGSMVSAFGSDGNKAEKLADSVNEIIFETGLKCYGSNGDLKNRFELSVIGYGADYDKVQPAWQGNLKDHWVVSIGEVFQNAVGEQDGIPIWIRPVAGQNTPMTRAFENAYRLCESWINWGNHMDCHPPIVINITDGVATDSGLNDQKLVTAANNLKSLSTNYGGVNIFNIHISSEQGDTILFPSQIASATQYASLLFNISTPLNPQMVKLAGNLGYQVSTGSRGYVYNGSAKNLMDFLNIGSNPI